jgi:pilus assembly protein CpaE
VNDQTVKSIITILLVEDMVDFRDNVKKLLGFEADFEVVGTAGTGREGLDLAIELQPDIIMMDINMPDMDGLAATTEIVNRLPNVGIIILSGQNDAHYMRSAMLAGAKAYLTKPASIDEIFRTVRTVHEQSRRIAPNEWNSTTPPEDGLNRAGNIIVVYSPQGGAGCTTIATNVASALMREDVRVLLVDANLQFGDVGVFLNLQEQSTMSDLVETMSDLDIEFLEQVIVTHDSGLKVLLGPARPQLAEKIAAVPASLSTLLNTLRWSYDFIVVDTSLNLDEMLLSLMDMATRILLICNPTLPSMKNTRFVLDIFDKLDYQPDKMVIVMNRVSEDLNIRKITIPVERMVSFLKHSIDVTIPSHEFLMLDAIRKGLPATASQRDQNKSPVKELIGLAEMLYALLMEQPQIDAVQQQNTKVAAKVRAER